MYFGSDSHYITSLSVTQIEFSKCGCTAGERVKICVKERLQIFVTSCCTFRPLTVSYKCISGGAVYH